MDHSTYIGLARQSGLMREMRVIANNIANASTAGFKREQVLFSEYVVSSPDGPSQSFAFARIGSIDGSAGVFTQTGGALDFAIQGEGYFGIETPQGQRLTRSGVFLIDAEGALVDARGNSVLDMAGAPILLDGGADIFVAADGTVSQESVIVARLGVFRPLVAEDLQMTGGASFRADNIEPFEEANILQGHIEESNVNSVTEISRLIEVQRAYEMGQKLLDNEDGRFRKLIETFGQ